MNCRRSACLWARDYPRGMGRLAVSLAAMSLVAAGCAGTTSDLQAGVPTTSSVSSEQPTPSDAVGASSSSVPSTSLVNAANGEWVTTTPVFEVNGYGESVEPTQPRVDILTSAVGAYWAAGSIGGHPTIWRSDDLVDFKVVYFGDGSQTPRSIRFSSLVEFDGKVLAGGPGISDRNIERSFVIVTSDSGENWSDIDNPMLSAPFQRLDNMVVSGGGLLLDLVNDECCSRPVWQPMHTTDLVSFDPVVLPDSTAETWGSFISDSVGTVWVVAQVRDLDPAQAVWSSIDGGRSWIRSAREVQSSSGMAAVDGSLMLIRAGQGFAMLSGPISVKPRELIRISDGEWSTLDDDVGQWGDGPATLWGINDPDTGRFYGIAKRSIRANPHYCFDNVDTCAQTELALVTSADGVDWFDLAGPEPRPRHTIPFMTIDGRIAIWSGSLDGNPDEPLTVTRWVGDPLPSLTDPAGYPPPVAPIPFFDPAEGLPVGTQRRAVWGLGACGGLFLDGISWAPTGPLDTTGWPILELQISDGPSAVAYGRITRVAEDLIRFTIEGTDIAVDLTPATDDGPGCG